MHSDKAQKEDDLLEIDLARVFQNILRIFRRMWLPMLIITVFFAGAVVFIQQKSYTPSYKAYCTFSVHVINKATLSDTNSLYAVYYDQDLAAQLDATFSFLINSDFLTDDIKEYLDTATIDGKIQANSIKGSNIFVLSTYSSSPEKAGELLEALMAVYYDAARYVVGDMKTEIIEGPVISQTPYNVPSYTKGIAIGGAIGLAFSVAMMGLYAIFRRTVFKPSDLEKHLNMQCMGVVPLMQMKRNLTDNLNSDGASAERGLFKESIRGIARKIETAIQSGEKKVILVTSTASAEGKSTISQNLAETFAQWGKKVVLIDGDLRRPALYRRCGFKHEKFLLEKVLSGEATADTVTRSLCDGKLTLLLNSELIERPTVSIDSSAMKKMIKTFSDLADIVIIDSPPCGQFSDASLYQQYADGVIYVVQQDRMAISQIVHAAENLFDAENKLLGYVLNGAGEISQGYGKYGYGKYSYGRYGSYGKYGYYSKYGYGKTDE